MRLQIDTLVRHVTAGTSFARCVLVGGAAREHLKRDGYHRTWKSADFYAFRRSPEDVRVRKLHLLSSVASGDGWAAVWYFSAAVTSLLFLAGCLFIWGGVLQTKQLAPEDGRPKVHIYGVMSDPSAIMLLGAMLLSGLSCMPPRTILPPT